MTQPDTLHTRLRAEIDRREEWRPIESTSGLYMASSLGRIRGPRRILRATADKKGYLRVAVCTDRQRTKQVHALVAEAFLGSKPTDHQVNHKDGNRSNNAVSNLEYVTASGNMQHAYHVLGRENPRGEANYRSKLTADRVLEMRRRRAQGAACREMAKDYGVTICTVRNATDGKTWRHLPLAHRLGVSVDG